MGNEIGSTLLSMGEEAYRDFIAKLLPTVEKSRIIGIRTPLLRKFAAQLEDYEDFLEALPHTYYEENNLHAFLIERERDFDKCVAKLDAFLPYVDNWATCDSLKPKALKKQPERLLKQIRIWLKSESTYTVRYAIGLLMNLYLDENFDETIFESVADVHSEEYYVNMMRAWFFATALAKRYEQAVTYLEAQTLDVWTHNKTIRKAVESLRISTARKTYLKSLKR